MERSRGQLLTLTQIPHVKAALRDVAETKARARSGFVRSQDAHAQGAGRTLAKSAHGGATGT